MLATLAGPPGKLPPSPVVRFKQEGNPYTLLFESGSWTNISLSADPGSTDPGILRAPKKNLKKHASYFITVQSIFLNKCHLQFQQIFNVIFVWKRILIIHVDPDPGGFP